MSTEDEPTGLRVKIMLHYYVAVARDDPGGAHVRVFGNAAELRAFMLRAAEEEAENCADVGIGEPPQGWAAKSDDDKIKWFEQFDDNYEIITWEQEATFDVADIRGVQ